jgi:phosphohistidine swiveling domain-containing protein
VRWDPPGPGMWELDRSHYPGGTTPIAQWLMGSTEIGMRKAFAELGMPADTLAVGFVNGFMYTRLRPLLAPKRATTRLPPAVVLRVVASLHPEMRRRAARAQRSLAERPWRRVVSEWDREIRPRLEAENAALNAVDVNALDQAELTRHIDGQLDRCHENAILHFYLHAFDLGPIGLLLASCEGWGIAAREVVPALAGASPSTSAPARTLALLRAELGTSPRPATIAEVRAASPEAARLLDDYLALRGRMLVTRYDLDGATLEEQPSVLLATILDGTAAPIDESQIESLTASLRARVPADQQATFDERLHEARSSMDLRDDNGPNTFELPVGILRHSLLELGRRLHAAGRIHERTHVFELERDEVVPLGRDGGGPTADELAERAAERRRLARLDPPLRLGPTEVAPPLDVLAPAHRQLVGAVQAVLTHMGMAGEERSAGGPLHGAGVGTAVYQGTARVAFSPEDALEAMEPGDVLVVRFTTPAYNTVLPLAGAIVTAEGALLSHAAVMARELGIPAVIGAPGALDVADGARVEVDPVHGTVRVLAESM